MPIKHSKVSSVPDGADASVVRPSDWNADHDISGQITVTDGSIVQESSGQPETIGPEHWQYARNGRWFRGIDVANSLKARDLVLAGLGRTYAFDDGATTSGTATLTSASQGGFAAAMVGATLSGAGIPAGTTVASVESATSLTMSAAATASGTGVRVLVTQDAVSDIIYLKHRGARRPTIGLGVTPPSDDYATQIASSDTELAMGTLGLGAGPGQTGHVLALYDSAGPVAGLRRWIDANFRMRGATEALDLQATDDSNDRSLVLRDSDGANVYGFTHPTGSGGEMRVRYIDGGVDILRFTTGGAMIHQSTLLGFYGAAATTKPAVSGSRGGNDALASLLTALAALGLITDSSTV